MLVTGGLPPSIFLAKSKTILHLPVVLVCNCKCARAATPPPLSPHYSRTQFSAKRLPSQPQLCWCSVCIKLCHKDIFVYFESVLCICFFGKLILQKFFFLFKRIYKILQDVFFRYCHLYSLFLGQTFDCGRIIWVPNFRHASVYSTYPCQMSVRP